MGESEKFEAQGRAHAELKKLKSDIAMAAARRTLGHLSDIAIDTQTFLKDPASQGPNAPALNGLVLLDNLRYKTNKTLENLAALVEEIHMKTQRRKELEVSIGDF